ncbi:MAG: type II toxin-antitoxin system Phd/YefM family antitoxin [Ignavibacteriota bacterium]|jgi:prevent-host-death family protein|nr:MAG: type II toxin-antitoxin system Phd/YefM family antitoxin [Chlorobiota bacterium]MBE7476491.1 type II toxin-antitoxin system Phd/YefM family antitoxin [Ignavibacteriales bacterium]MBL1123626.1 type II toxin-antitoxin system Phd/YefM family antitoxin [Ignavibacteriota bacterium]MCC7094474.1 type II toxin-antitoxin system Phd/YefM family antitoxin [Ignavibacteriaceae bacterium]MCE7855517.1 type II toxin-antitoxin system Phd/YefM family antitoxin [Ignavibacteria bacterium CHB3]MEB2296355.1
MTQVNIHEAKTNLSKLIDKVLKGESVIISKSNKPVVKLVLVDEMKNKRSLGTAKESIKISEDFDAPVNEFKEYI